MIFTLSDTDTHEIARTLVRMGVRVRRRGC